MKFKNYLHLAFTVAMSGVVGTTFGHYMQIDSWTLLYTIPVLLGLVAAITFED